MALARRPLAPCFWLCLLWLLPQTGFAAPQDLSLLDADTSGSHAAWASPSRGAETFARRWHRPRASRPSLRADGPATPARRLTLEIALGLLGGTLGGVAGYFGTAASSPCANSAPFCDKVVLATNGFAGLGIVLGVYAGGELYQGEGDLVFGPFLGAAAGFVLGSLIALPFVKGIGLITCPPLMLLGALGAYELTVKGPTAFRRVQPMVGVTPQGAQLGLMGRF